MPEQQPDLDNEYDKHVQEKHEKWDTPEETLFSEVAAVSSLKPLSRTRIVKGENSEVYKIQTEEGKGLIARISHSENPRFERERWALNQVRSAGVPVPEVLGIKEVQTEDGLITISVESELQGIPLEEINSIQNPESEDLFKKLMKEAGAILAKIHSVKTDGFGPLDKSGKGQWQTLEEVWLEMEKWRDEVLGVAVKANVNSELITRALDAMKEAATNVTITAPVLVHDDYAPKHIMVDGEQISGIIDFETCVGGDPVRDFARWQYHKKDFPIEYLLEGYTAKLPADFDTRLKLWKVHMGLTTLEYYLADGNKAAIHNTVSKLEEDLDSLR